MTHGERLLSVIERSEPHLRALSDDVASAAIAPGKWTRKQLIGHLIDSAANNHQRFVRAAIDDNVTASRYEQDKWVAAQQYDRASWSALIALWREYNLHLARVVDAIPAERRAGTFPFHPPMTLDALIADYIDHVEHHLGQL
jgi:hypothetical protein